MSLYNLRFFSRFLCLCNDQTEMIPGFAGLLQVSVTTGSHKPLSAVINILISVIRRHTAGFEIASIVVVPNTVPRGD